MKVLNRFVPSYVARSSNVKPQIYFVFKGTSILFEYFTFDFIRVRDNEIEIMYYSFLLPGKSASEGSTVALLSKITYLPRSKSIAEPSSMLQLLLSYTFYAFTFSSLLLCRANRMKSMSRDVTMCTVNDTQIILSRRE